MGKLAVAAVGGVFVLLLSFALMAGTSGVHLASASPPAGGCTIRVTGSDESGSASGSGFPDMPQRSAELDAEQMAAARTVVAVGKAMSITERGVAIALGTAMQESSLRPQNTDGYGVGLYMQQGALYADVNRRDPAAAARAFYEQLLKQVPNYDNPEAVPFAVAAQTVQASGAGAKYYARWREWALALADRLYSGTESADGGAGQVHCQVGGGSGPIPVRISGLTVYLPERAPVDGRVTFPNSTAATAAAAALSYLGTAYAWGGGTVTGPSEGFGIDAGVVGFDCSSLVMYAYAQAGVNLPRVSQAQQRVPVSLPWSEADPGDLLFWGSPAHHVALYLGRIDGVHYMVEAPHSGSYVQVSRVRTGGDFQHTVVRPYATAGGDQ